MASLEIRYKLGTRKQSADNHYCLQECVTEVRESLDPYWSDTPIFPRDWPRRLLVNIQGDHYTKFDLLKKWTILGRKLFGVVPNKVSRNNVEIDFLLHKPPWFLYIVSDWYRFCLDYPEEALQVLDLTNRYKNIYIALAHCFSEEGFEWGYDEDRGPVIDMGIYSITKYFGRPTGEYNNALDSGKPEVAYLVGLMNLLSGPIEHIDYLTWWDRYNKGYFRLWKEAMRSNLQTFGAYTFAFVEKESLESDTVRKMFSGNLTNERLRALIKRKDFQVIRGKDVAVRE